MVERSLHEAIKNWYSHPGDLLEQRVDGYVVDIVRDKLLIEIQTGNFSAIKDKIMNLIAKHHLRLVLPIAKQKWIIKLGSGEREILSKRKSPKKGRVEDVFNELVYLPKLIKDSNFSLDVLFIHSKEVLIDDGLGSWRRRKWSVHDRHLLKVVENVMFKSPSDFLELLPENLLLPFTVGELAKELKLRVSLAQKMAYCLRKLGVIKLTGKRGRAFLYVPHEAAWADK